jgi:pyruvate kinase
VEVPFDRVPLIQKSIVKKCIEKARPVIIATQMMESMITNFRPTRAEANDVANAVVDGADALMLSGETSVGEFPIEAVRNMQKIIDWTECNGYHYNRKHAPVPGTKTFLPDSLCYNTHIMTDQTGARAIIPFTHSGYSAIRISSHRPKADIFTFTSDKDLVSKLSLVWGVRCFHMEMGGITQDSIQKSIQILKKKDLIESGDIVIHLASIPIPEKGPTNMVKLSYAE